MANFNLIWYLPEVERLVLDRLSVKDICNVALVNKQTLALNKNFAKKDHGRCSIFTHRSER